jgi:hypothetical protein
MPSMRDLLASDPSLPRETREAIARGDDATAGRGLVELGVNVCEAAELLGYDCAGFTAGSARSSTRV